VAYSKCVKSGGVLRGLGHFVLKKLKLFVSECLKMLMFWEKRVSKTAKIPSSKIRVG